MTLNVGDPAPDFSLPDSTGKLTHLHEFRGQWVVLYFYPRDNTPGCTKEACGFRDAYLDYQSSEVVVLGISADDAKSHQKFIQKYELPFPLLCDIGGEVARNYASYGLKKFMGKEFEGVYRHSFLIDPEGNLARIYHKVKPETHARELLQDLETLRNPG